MTSKVFSIQITENMRPVIVFCLSIIRNQVICLLLSNSNQHASIVIGNFVHLKEICQTIEIKLINTVSTSTIKCNKLNWMLCGNSYVICIF